MKEAATKEKEKDQSGTSGTNADRCIDGVRSPFSGDWFSKWSESGTRVPPDYSTARRPGWRVTSDSNPWMNRMAETFLFPFLLHTAGNPV